MTYDTNHWDSRLDVIAETCLVFATFEIDREIGWDHTDPQEPQRFNFLLLTARSELKAPALVCDLTRYSQICPHEEPLLLLGGVLALRRT